MKKENIKRIKCVIIAGLPKTGTTLPLTLLDNHPELLVFPEELRFFNLGCDREDGKEAADNLLKDENIKQLSKRDYYYKNDDYLAHGGTGFGKRDYSKFDFDKFESIIRSIFYEYKDPAIRFFGLITAFNSATGRSSLDNNTIFVCKAPHNELFIQKWKRMLGLDGQYILCTRIPTEHFLSLKNIANFQNKKRNINIYDYLQLVKGRLKLWRLFPLQKTFILDYDILINDTFNTVTKMCKFLNIMYNDSLLRPTKMGVPWAGNSSRNIVKEQIFKNEHKANKLLNSKEIETIEFGLRNLYKKMDWKNTDSIGYLNRLIFQYQIISRKFFKKVGSFVPKSVKRKIKARINSF